MAEINTESWPNSPEELTLFYITHGVSLFQYIHDNYDHDVNLETRARWIIKNKDWAVDEAYVKRWLGSETIPVMGIKFSSIAIVHNRFIFVPFRTDWAREEVFEEFGLYGSRQEISDQLTQNQSLYNGQPWVIFRGGNNALN